MANKFKYVLLVIGLLFSITKLIAQNEIEEDEIIINKEFFGVQHELEEIQVILSKFDTYDYVRTKNQKEETVRFLLKEAERLEYTIGIAKCKNILGVLLRDKAEYAEAIDLHESALKLSDGDSILTIYSLNNLGVVYRRLDKPRIALDYHMKALELAEKYKGNPEIAERSVCVALNSIGNLNLSLNQPEKALEVFNETLQIEKRLNNDLGMAINYQNIGYSYEALDKPDIAIVYYKKSLEQNKKIESDVGRSICYNSIGELQLKQNKVNEALDNFKLAMVFARKTNDEYYISQTRANIGEAYLALNNFKKALPELLEYRNSAEKINSGYLLQDSYRLLSKYFEKSGDFEKSLILFKKAVQYNDSIVNEKNTRYLNEIQTVYDAKKKQQQIEFLTIENRIKTQKNIFYLFGFLVLILILIVIYILNKRKTDNQKNELESRLFRSLMNPHFIFNALGSIQNFLYKNEAEKAAVYLGYFSKLTRSILKNSNKELITLEEEITSLKNYIEIEQMRQSGCFKYEINFDKDLELDFIYVLPTMIQPFVENAIHHGIGGADCENGLIQINLKQNNDTIKITIKDNGKGIKSNQNAPKKASHKSMGLLIFKERIRLIEKKFKKSVNFVIKDLKDIDPKLNGTIVTIDFPLIEPND